ncbi:MAG: hypothetical protein HC817_03350 [Saprospiraceae bacterium]|nr:hypothetical protein [Saprospiraceae bacterium]
MHAFWGSIPARFFQLISIVTCTGFATCDYMLWPQYIWVILFFAMLLGAAPDLLPVG